MSVVENTGSTARDYCMLERNILSHFRLGLLLSLLSSSVLLHARIPSPTASPPSDSKAGLPMATLQMIAAMGAIAAGSWEYWSGSKDLKNMRAFLVASKPHTAILTIVAGVVFTTCVILLADEGQL